MKSEFISKISLFVFMLILLCTITVCLFTYAIGMRITEPLARPIVIIVFAIAVCLVTAILIAKFTKSLVEQTIIKVYDYGKKLEIIAVHQRKAVKDMRTAFFMINEIVKNIKYNAEMINEFSNLAAEVADICEKENIQEKTIE